MSWVLEAIEKYSAELLAIGSQPPPAPRWDQDWFPRLDAAAAYAIVRESRPRRIVEVGSGHSTRFLARAVADGWLRSKFTAIDPQPRASIQGLPIEFVGMQVQEAGLSSFRQLEGNDILFIDSSHQMAPGSDVAFLVEEVLPALPGGVLVHFHDVFLPDDYPEQWAWRKYNEQDCVKDLLLRHTLEFSSHWIATRAPETIPAALTGLPLLPSAIESSLWLRTN